MKTRLLIITLFISFYNNYCFCQPTEQKILISGTLVWTQYPWTTKSNSSKVNIESRFTNSDTSIILILSTPVNSQYVSSVFLRAENHVSDSIFFEISSRITNLFLKDTITYQKWLSGISKEFSKSKIHRYSKVFEQLKIDYEIKNSKMFFTLFDPIHHLMEF